MSTSNAATGRPEATIAASTYGPRSGPRSDVLRFKYWLFIVQHDPAVTRESSAEFQALLDATVDGVVLIDARGHIEAFNRAAQRLFGYSEQELIGRNVSVLMTWRDRDSHDGYMERYQRTGVPHIIGIGREVEARRKDGSEFPAFLSIGRVGDTSPPRFVGFLHDITLRRETMAAIRHERDLASMYFEVAQVILVALTADLRVQRINRKGCEILGRTSIDLVGCAWLACAVVPDEHHDVHAQLLAALKNDAGMELYGEYSLMAADGQRRLVAWRSAALRDAQGKVAGLLASGEDITARRAFEREMDRTRRLLDEAQQTAYLGNYELQHPPGDSDFWSAQVYRLFGLDPESETMSIERFNAAVHPDDSERFARDWSHALTQPGAYSSHHRILNSRGEVRFVQSNFQTQSLSTGQVRIAGTVLDVTSPTLAREAARTAEQRMAQVARLTMLGEMTAGIAHEINQPLAAIANYASAAGRMLPSDLPGAADLRECVGQIASQAVRAGEIIRRLRSLVKDRTMKREPADINDLVREVVGFARNDAELQGVQLRTELIEGLPPLMIDRIQLQQVILNLMRNGIEAFGEFRGEEHEVVVSTAAAAGRQVEVAVRDNGPGVLAEVLERIFDPFCSTKPKGTGLGLAISRKIIDAHGGRLFHESNPPHGARFVIQLDSEASENRNST